MPAQPQPRNLALVRVRRVVQRLGLIFYNLAFFLNKIKFAPKETSQNIYRFRFLRNNFNKIYIKKY